MHYLVTSSNYEDFVEVKQKLEPVSDVDNISEICGNQVHPWYAWMTHNITLLVVLELATVLVILALTAGLSIAFDWSVFLSIVFFTTLALFSVWVSGLIGWHKIHLYSICQTLTEHVEHPLALLVDSKEKSLASVTSKYDSIQVTRLDE